MLLSSSVSNDPDYEVYLLSRQSRGDPGQATGLPYFQRFRPSSFRYLMKLYHLTTSTLAFYNVSEDTVHSPNSEETLLWTWLFQSDLVFH
jgi:hypothetical protein